MRLIFSGARSAGELLPMLGLLHAARDEGHRVAVLTGRGMVPFLLREVGCDVCVLDPGTGEEPAPAGPVLEAIERAVDWRPDAVISATGDELGPLVAAAQRVPLYRHHLGPAVATPPLAADESAARRCATSRGLRLPVVAGWIDVTPSVLQDPAVAPAEPWIPMSGAPRRREDCAHRDALTDGSDFRWNVLTTVQSTPEHPRLPERIVRSIDGRHANVDVALADDEKVPALEPTPNLAFRPVDRMGELLDGADVLVTAGDPEEVLAALALGVPLVILPLRADQGVLARRLAGIGAALVVSDPARVGPAVERVVRECSFIRAAKSARDEIALAPAALRIMRRLEREIAATVSRPTDLGS